MNPSRIIAISAASLGAIGITVGLAVAGTSSNQASVPKAADVELVSATPTTLAAPSVGSTTTQAPTAATTVASAPAATAPKTTAAPAKVSAPSLPKTFVLDITADASKGDVRLGSGFRTASEPVANDGTGYDMTVAITNGDHTWLVAAHSSDYKHYSVVKSIDLGKLTKGSYVLGGYISRDVTTDPERPQCEGFYSGVISADGKVLRAFDTTETVKLREVPAADLQVIDSCA